jgi:hypothetical protein
MKIGDVHSGEDLPRSEFAVSVGSQDAEAEALPLAARKSADEPVERLAELQETAKGIKRSSLPSPAPDTLA